MENCRYFWKYPALLLLGAGIWSPSFSLAAQGNKTKAEKRTTYGTAVEAGFKFVRYHDNCIFLRIFFVSGDFFLGLKQVDTPTGKQFVRGRQIYHSFPDSIVVDVQADAIPCDISTQRLPPSDIASGFLSALSFAPVWRINSDDLESRVIVPKQIEHSKGGIRWNYFFEIPTKDIPLTTELVIRLTAREPIELGTLSANL